jgi:hypothetical protein
MSTYTYVQAAENAYRGMLVRWNNMVHVKGPNAPPASFWITANTFNAFLDYWICTGQSPDQNITRPIVDYFHETVKENATDDDLKKLAEQGLAKGPWLDDYGWWGNAFLTAWENANALGFSGDDVAMCKQSTINCWTIMKYGWDTKNTPPVPGGVWNCQHEGWRLTGRNTVTNSVFWLMSVRLAALTNDSKYLDPDSLQWFEDGFAKDLLFDKAKDQNGNVYTVYTVRERFIGEHDSDAAPGFYWAGDQGLFLRCLFEEKRTMQPAFAQLKTQIVDAVSSNMVDGQHVIHDHTMPKTLDIFDNDYATGKGIFIRHALKLVQLTGNQDLKDCIMASANFAWNTSTQEPDFNNYFQFCWNTKGTLPPGNWDLTYKGAPSEFRGVILQASGLNAISAAAALNPNGVIPQVT